METARHVPRRGFRRRGGEGARAGCLVGAGLLVALALPCSGLASLGMLAASPGGFAVAVVLAVLGTVPYTAALLWLDRNEQEPVWLLALAFTWGALVATSLAGLANDLFGAFAVGAVGDPVVAQALTASISAPVAEELAKGLALLVIVVAFSDELDNVLDGLVYGALIGLGFAWFENIVYYVGVAEQGVGEMVKLAWVRGALSGIGSHAAYSGLLGVGVGLFRVARRGAARWLLPPVFLVLAMGAHFTWNTFGGLFAIGAEGEAAIYLLRFPLAVLVLQLPFVFLLACVVALVWNHEKDIIVAFLAGEAPAVCSDEERLGLVPARLRLLRSAARLRRHGPAAWWWHRQLDRLQIRLAFAKWHHHYEAPGWAVDDDAGVRAIRAAIRALRAR